MQAYYTLPTISQLLALKVKQYLRNISKRTSDKKPEYGRAILMLGVASTEIKTRKEKKK